MERRQRTEEGVAVSANAADPSTGPPEARPLSPFRRLATYPSKGLPSRPHTVSRPPGGVNTAMDPWLAASGRTAC
jgi:hypothetical protein